MMPHKWAGFGFIVDYRFIRCVFCGRRPNEWTLPDECADRPRRIKDDNREGRATKLHPR